MSILELFDKLDDIIYEPVKSVCNWINEPLNNFEDKRKKEAIKQDADIEYAKTAQAAQIETDRMNLEAKLKDDELKSQNQAKKAEAEINADIRRWNAEIDQMINEHEDARRDKLVESIKRYQIDLANATKEIVENIGMMSIELRKEANDMVQEKTEKYIALQKKAEEDAMNRLEEIGKRFANNERVRIRMEDSIMDNMESIVNHAGSFITELSEEMKSLNANTDSLIKMGMKNINDYLRPMANALNISSDNNVHVGFADDDFKKIETNV